MKANPNSGRQRVLRTIDSLGDRSFNSVTLSVMTGLPTKHTSSVLTELRDTRNAIRVIDETFPVTYQQIGTRVRSLIKKPKKNIPTVELLFEDTPSSSTPSKMKLLSLFSDDELIEELKRRSS